jgi:signal transduction histidine kinase
MLEEAARLTRLVDSLLTIARADAGQIQLERTAIRLVPLVRDVTNFLEVLADEKAQKLSVEGDESLEVEADGAILQQVITNLLDNAIRYSYPGGAITVRVLNDDHSAVIEVEDNGPGIPPEHRDKIFDRFYRVDSGRSRDTGGAGLGLAIAKWGAEAHGGHVELRCPAAGGCIFRLVMPVKHTTATVIRTSSESDVQKATSLATRKVS